MPRKVPELARALRAARQRTGMTQREAAEALRLDEFSVYRIEAGQRGIADDTLLRCAQLYLAPHLLALHPIGQAVVRIAGIDWPSGPPEPDHDGPGPARKAV